jgi:TM2 domain-containing membrane protein YozV
MCLALLLWLPPFGFFGLHRYYLRSYLMGAFFTLTLGGGGLSWLLDLFRIPFLLRECNQTPVNEPLRKSMVDAYLLQCNPVMGILGFARYYVRSYGIGVTFTLTCGYAGLGWLYDFVRLFWLVRDAQVHPAPKDFQRKRSLADAYLLMLPPLGLLGLQRFYLRSYVVGTVYFFTLSVFGLGYVFDLFYLSCLHEQQVKHPHGSTRVVIVQTTTSHDPHNPYLVTTTTTSTESTGDAIREGLVDMPAYQQQQGAYQHNQLYTSGSGAPLTHPQLGHTTVVVPPPSATSPAQTSDTTYVGSSVPPTVGSPTAFEGHDHTSIKVV